MIDLMNKVKINIINIKFIFNITMGCCSCKLYTDDKGIVDIQIEALTVEARSHEQVQLAFENENIEPNVTQKIY